MRDLANVVVGVSVSIFILAWPVLIPRMRRYLSQSSTRKWRFALGWGVVLTVLMFVAYTLLSVYVIVFFGHFYCEDFDGGCGYHPPENIEIKEAELRFRLLLPPPLRPTCDRAEAGVCDYVNETVNPDPGPAWVAYLGSWLIPALVGLVSVLIIGWFVRPMQNGVAKDPAVQSV